VVTSLTSYNPSARFRVRDARDSGALPHVFESTSGTARRPPRRTASWLRSMSLVFRTDLE
jgi:hypothetical protein